MNTATVSRVFHDTIVLERTYKASPARVFAAWQDVEARKRWSKPSDEIELVYERAEFRAGGEDIVRCGTSGNLKYLAKVRYLEIVPDARIVFSEHVSDSGVSQAAALIDVSMEASGAGTRQVVTIHVAAFDTPDMLQGYRDGWNPTLDKLADEF